MDGAHIRSWRKHRRISLTTFWGRVGYSGSYGSLLEREIRELDSEVVPFVESAMLVIENERVAQAAQQVARPENQAARHRAEGIHLAEV